MAPSLPPPAEHGPVELLELGEALLPPLLLLHHLLHLHLLSLLSQNRPPLVLSAVIPAVKLTSTAEKRNSIAEKQSFAALNWNSDPLLEAPVRKTGLNIAHAYTMTSLEKFLLLCKAQSSLDTMPMSAYAYVYFGISLAVLDTSLPKVNCPHFYGVHYTW